MTTEVERMLAGAKRFRETGGMKPSPLVKPEVKPLVEPPVKVLPLIEPIDIIRRVYPQYPDYKPEEIPVRIGELTEWATEDPEAFLYDLQARASETEVEEVLGLLGYELTPPEPTEEVIGRAISTVYPDMTPDAFVNYLETDPEAFVRDLYDRATVEEAEGFLRVLSQGAADESGRPFTQAEIDQSISATTAQFIGVERQDEIIKAVYPDMDFDAFNTMLEETPDKFVAQMRTGGRTEDKEALLEAMNFTELEMDELLRMQQIVVPVDGIRKLVTVDALTDRAYDKNGTSMGTYDPLTKEFTQATVGDRLADFFSAFRFGVSGMVQTTKDFALQMLPQLVFPDIKVGQSKVTGMSDEAAREAGLTYMEVEVNLTNERNKEIRNTFRGVAANERRKYEDWVEKHPELQPNPVYEAGPLANPELWKDPNWWAYEVASMAPITGTAMILGVGTTLITKNPMAGAAASGAFIAPVEMEAIRQDLLSEGVGEEQAAELAAVVGTAVVAVEFSGNYIQLLRMLPGFRWFPREVAKQVVKRTVRQLIKKGLTTFTILQFTETMEEVIQEVLGNVAVIMAGKDRSLFENIPELIPKVTAGMLPFSLLGTGISLVRVSPSVTKGKSDNELKGMGLVKDEITGNWYEKIKGIAEGEEGFVRLPGEPEGAPLTEALIKEGAELVESAEKIEATNPDVIKFKDYLKKAEEATTPEARREALKGMEALEDKVRAIAKVPEAVPEVPEVLAKARPTDAEMLEYYQENLEKAQAKYKRARGVRRETIGREIKGYEREIAKLEAKPLAVEVAPEVTRVGLSQERRVTLDEFVAGRIEGHESVIKSLEAKIAEVKDTHPKIVEANQKGIKELQGKIDNLRKGVFTEDEKTLISNVVKPEVAKPPVAEVVKAPPAKLRPLTAEEAKVEVERLAPQVKAALEAKTEADRVAKLSPKERAEAELKANREQMHDAVTKPREEGEIPRGTLRHPSHYRGMEDFTAEVNKELFSPIKESPLDTAAVAYLKTGDFADYLEALPEQSELKLQALSDEVKTHTAELEELRPYILEGRDLTAFEKIIKKLKGRENLTIEDAVSLGIALRTTRGGRILPAIRKSGFYVTTEFATSPHLQDVPYVSGFWQDIDALFEHIDGGRAAGTPADPAVAQKYMQRPTNRNFLAYKKWLDTYLLRCQEGFERFGLTGRISKAKWHSIFQTIEEVTAAEADFKTAQVLRKPAIQELLSEYDKETRSNIVEFAQWTRAFLDELRVMQNQAREKRGQETIGYIEKYLSWVAERNIWSTLGFGKRTPSEIHAKPPAPDFIYPDAPFNPRAMAREGGMSAYPMEKNVQKLLFDYVRTAGKDIFFTNTVQNNKIHIAALRSMGLFNTATLLEEYNAEVWAGAKPRITKAFEAFLPKPIPKAIYMIRRNLTRNVFPLNWIWSLTIQPSSIAFTAGRTGPINLVKGLDFLFMPSANRFARDTYTYIIKAQRSGKMAFQDVGTEVEKSLRWEGSFIDKAESYAGFMVNVVEKLLTGVSIRAGYHYGKALGFTGEELVEYASKMGAKTQSMYNIQNIPAVLRAKPVGALLPFQTFTIQAMNFTREMTGVSVWKAGAYETISAKSAEGKATISRRLILTASFIATMFVINMVIDKTTNRKPWMLSSFIPMVALLQMGLESSNPWNLLLPHKYISEFYTGFKQAIQYEDFTKLKRWFMNYHFPFGGSQINRMIDGIEAVLKGKVEDVRGTELFEVRQDEWFKAIFMGPYQTEGGREYIDKLQEKKGKWYEYTGIPITIKRVDINDEIDKNLALLGKTDEDGMKYNFGDFVSDLREIRRAVGEKRFNISVSPFIDGFKKAEASREIIEKLPPKKLKSMDEDDIAGFLFPEADPESVEVTALWTDFNTLKTKEQRRAFIADYIKQHADELKDNMVAKHWELLEDRELLTGKDLVAFDEGHPELTRDWRSEWRRDNPEDDARLAMYGYGGKIQTPEAFALIKKWSEELGIDLDHLPCWLPPKGSEENYFEFVKEMTERSWNSWEAQLILAKDTALREGLGYDPIDTPIASLELKVANREHYDTIAGYKDEDSPLYIEDDEKRAEAIEKIKLTKVDGEIEFRDIERHVEAIEKGTDTNPTPDDIVKAWAGRGREVDEHGGSSSEVMVWFSKNMETYRWALENELITDDGGLPDDDPLISEKGRRSDKWNIPALQISADWRELLDEKEAWKDPDSDTFIPADRTVMINGKEVDARQVALDKLYADNPEFRDDMRRQDVYNWYGTDRVADETVVEKHVEYSLKFSDTNRNNSSECYLWRHNNKGYDAFRTNVDIFGKDALDPLELEELPIWRIDVDFAKQDEEYQAILDKYEGKEETAETRAYLYDAEGNPTEYCLKRYERIAYKKGIPTTYKTAKGNPIDDFVDYSTNPALSKPDNWERKTGTDLWFEDDWWMMEHKDFYKEVYLGILGNERKDYRKVPTRAVFKKYLVYLDLYTDFDRKNYRLNNLDLDDWGQARFGWKSITEQKRRKGLTPFERGKEDIWEEAEEREEKLETIEEPLERIRKRRLLEEAK
jgi:hypothetical protein